MLCARLQHTKGMWESAALCGVRPAQVKELYFKAQKYDSFTVVTVAGRKSEYMISFHGGNEKVIICSVRIVTGI